MLEGIKSPQAAAAHACLGDKDEAFRLLFRMVEEREVHVFPIAAGKLCCKLSAYVSQLDQVSGRCLALYPAR